MVSEDQFNARSQQQEAVGSVCPEGGSRDQLRSHMAPLPQLNMAWLQSILVLSTSETALWQGLGDKAFPSPGTQTCFGPLGRAWCLEGQGN